MYLLVNHKIHRLLYELLCKTKQKYVSKDFSMSKKKKIKILYTLGNELLEQNNKTKNSFFLFTKKGYHKKKKRRKNLHTYIPQQ